MQNPEETSALNIEISPPFCMYIYEKAAGDPAIPVERLWCMIEDMNKNTYGFYLDESGLCGLIYLQNWGGNFNVARQAFLKILHTLKGLEPRHSNLCMSIS